VLNWEAIARAELQPLRLAILELLLTDPPDGDPGWSARTVGDGMTLTVPKRALVAVLVLLAVAGGAAAGYFLRQSDVDSARKSGYSDGLAAGRVDGHRAAESDYTEGSSRWTTIHEDGRQEGYSNGYRTGYKAGRKSGLRDGRASGYASGQVVGLRSGQDEAFEGYSGGWEVDRWYLIHIGTGKDVGLSGKYSIPSRVGPMRYGTRYALCDDGDDICSG